MAISRIILSLFFFIVSLLTFHLAHTREEIESHLIYTFPKILSINFFLIFVFVIFCWKVLKKEITCIDKKTLLIVLGIFVVSFFLQGSLSPKTHRIYYDEDIYLNIGQSIAFLGKAALCNYGITEQGEYDCYDGVLNKQPQAYPFILSLLFKITGTSEENATILTIIVSSLSTILVFFIAKSLYNAEIGIYSSLIFALIPENVLWSSTNASEPFLAFFSILTLSMLFMSFKENNILLFVLSLLLAAFTIQIKTEAALLLVPYLSCLIIFKKNIIFTNKWGFFLSIVLFLCLIFPHALHLMQIKGENWGAPTNEKFSVKYFNNNLKENVGFYFENKRFPLFFTLMSIAGICLQWKKWREKLFVLSWGLPFFSVYLFFYAGSYNAGVGERYSILMSAVISILAGIAIDMLSKTLGKYGKFILITIVISNFAFFLPYIASVGEKGWEAREDHNIIKILLPGLEEGSFVFTHIPSYVLVHSKGALQMWYAQNTSVVDKLLAERRPLYVFTDYWTVLEPQKSNFVYIMKNFYTKKIITVKIRDRIYSLYKIITKKEVNLSK